MFHIEGEIRKNDTPVPECASARGDDTLYLECVRVGANHLFSDDKNEVLFDATHVAIDVFVVRFMLKR